MISWKCPTGFLYQTIYGGKEQANDETERESQRQSIAGNEK